MSSDLDLSLLPPRIHFGQPGIDYILKSATTSADHSRQTSNGKMDFRSWEITDFHGNVGHINIIDRQGGLEVEISLHESVNDQQLMRQLFRFTADICSHYFEDHTVIWKTQHPNGPLARQAIRAGWRSIKSSSQGSSVLFANQRLLQAPRSAQLHNFDEAIIFDLLQEPTHAEQLLEQYRMSTSSSDVKIAALAVEAVKRALYLQTRKNIASPGGFNGGTLASVLDETLNRELRRFNLGHSYREKESPFEILFRAALAVQPVSTQDQRHIAILNENTELMLSLFSGDWRCPLKLLRDQVRADHALVTMIVDLVPEILADARLSLDSKTSVADIQSFALRERDTLMQLLHYVRANPQLATEPQMLRELALQVIQVEQHNPNIQPLSTASLRWHTDGPSTPRYLDMTPLPLPATELATASKITMGEYTLDAVSRPRSPNHHGTLEALLEVGIYLASPSWGHTINATPERALAILHEDSLFQEDLTDVLPELKKTPKAHKQTPSKTWRKMYAPPAEQAPYERGFDLENRKTGHRIRVLGVEHRFDSRDPLHLALITALDEFRASSARSTAAIIERPVDPTWLGQDPLQAADNGGDAGVLTAAAYARNLDVHCLEPTVTEQLRYLTGIYGKEAAQYFLLSRNVLQYINSLKQDVLNSEDERSGLAEYLRMRQDGLFSDGSERFWYCLSNFERLYAFVEGEHLDLGNIKMLNNIWERCNWNPNAGKVPKIVEETKRFRDRATCKRLVTLLDECDLFASYGAPHVMSMAALLKQQLGSDWMFHPIIARTQNVGFRLEVSDPFLSQIYRSPVGTQLHSEPMSICL